LHGVKVNNGSVQPLGYSDINILSKCCGTLEQLKTMTCKVRIDFVVLLVFWYICNKKAQECIY